MPIKSIIIDNKQTKAKRIAPDKVQLDLVALPLDEQNDTEPNLDIRLYVNGQLLQNLQSGADGVIKGNIVIDSSDAEQLTIALEEITQGVKSKIKCVMISGGEEFEQKIEKSESSESEQKIEENKPDRKPEILDFVTKNGRNLSDEKCKDYINDFDVVMAAVRQNGLALQFASENLRNNYDIIMTAVKQNGLALEFASLQLRDIKEIGIEAIKQNVLAYDFCGTRLLDDEEILEILFNTSFNDFSLLDKLSKIPSNPKTEFHNIFCGNAPAFGKSSHIFIKKNKEVVLHIIQKTQKDDEYDVFDNMSDIFKNDIEIIKKMIQIMLNKREYPNEHQRNIIYKIICPLSDSFKKDLILDLFSKMKIGWQSFLSDFLQNHLYIVGNDLFNDETFLMTIFNDYGTYLHANGNDGFKEKHFMIQCLIKINGCKLIRNKEFVLKLIKSSNDGNENTVNYEPYSIFRDLLISGSILFRDEVFVLKSFEEINVPGIESLLSECGYHFDSIRGKINDILKRKKSGR